LILRDLISFVPFILCDALSQQISEAYTIMAHVNDLVNDLNINLTSEDMLDDQKGPSKQEEHDKYEGEHGNQDEDDQEDDDEDALLDEMLRKAEVLRLAMLAASSTKNLGDHKHKHSHNHNHKQGPITGSSSPAYELAPTMGNIHSPSAPSNITNNNNNNNNATEKPARRSNIERQRCLGIGVGTSTNISMNININIPAIPETIETTDNVTECSSVGYYSIVYGSTVTNQKTPAQKKASRQWLREQSSTPHMLSDELLLEEEKTNEDGSIHHAFSDDGSACRRRPVIAPPIASSWSMSMASNNEMQSPLAISPPNDDDDQMVSVADYLNSKLDPNNPGDDHIWVKVDFVDQSDDDYVPLQDYSRANFTDLAFSNAEIDFHRRKHLRKLVTFGLCCVVLGFLWIRLSADNNHANQSSHVFGLKALSATTTSTPVQHKVIGAVGVGVAVKEQATAIVARVAATKPTIQRSLSFISKNSPSMTTRTARITSEETINVVNAETAIAIRTVALPNNKQDAQPKHRFLKAVLTPGRMKTRMIWENPVIDRRLILESFVQSMMQ
jgi:hypothetical protein